MTEWENNPLAIKDSFDKATTYFEGLIRDYKVYKQNSSSTAGKHSYERANQSTEANSSNKPWQYTAGIAKAVVAQEEQATNIHNSTKVMTDAMTAQIKAMSDQIAQLTKAIANKENAPNNGGGGNSGSSGSSSSRNKGQARCEDVQYNKLHTMGLFLTRFPSCQREPHERHLLKVTCQPQCHGHMEQQKRRQRLLAKANLHQR